jgi:hypothetical protein
MVHSEKCLFTGMSPYVLYNRGQKFVVISSGLENVMYGFGHAADQRLAEVITDFILPYFRDHFFEGLHTFLFHLPEESFPPYTIVSLLQSMKQR